MTTFRRRSETRIRIAHAIAGAGILTEAWVKVEEHQIAIAAVMAVLGTAMMLLARFHERLHHSAFARHLDSAAFLMESTVLYLIAAVFFHHGKHALPWCYAAAATGYAALAVWRHFRPYTQEQQSSASDHLGGSTLEL